jgi:hypothetical protein
MDKLGEYIAHLRRRGLRGDAVGERMLAVSGFCYWMVQRHGPPAHADRITDDLVAEYIRANPGEGALVSEFHRWLRGAA